VEDVMGIIQNRDAQFMLLASFIIALGLVITTVVLNSIIFEGNMAVEGGSELSKYELVNMIQITKDEMKNAYNNSTQAGGTKDNSIANFSRQMKNFSTNLPRMFALHGGAVNVTWDIDNWNKTRYANFTDNGMPAGAANWTVVEGINVSSVYIFNLSNVTILSGKSFKIEARNSTGSSIWSIEFNNTNYTVTNLTNTSTGITPLPNVNLSLPIYYFNNSTSSYSPVSIHFINGNNSYGMYKIQGMANGRNFYRERHYVLNTTSTFSTSKFKINMTIPVSVPR
jgi:hypothetical protein